MEANFTTKDLNLAAYLYASGQDLAGVERQGTVCWFLFAQRVHCEELATAYWNGKAECGVRLFVDAQRVIKDIIFSA